MFVKLFILFSFALLLVAILIGFLSKRLFDRLLRIQFDEAHSEWARQGGPIGFSWIPDEAEFASGTHARDILYDEWRLTTPNWIAVSQRAERAYLLWRRFAVLAPLSGSVFLVIWTLAILISIIFR